MANNSFRIDQVIPAWLRNIFYKPSDKFYMQNNSFLIGKKDSVYIKTDKLYEIYNTIAELKQVIDRDASMFSNMEILERDINTGETSKIQDPELSRLLSNPNPLQSQNAWLTNYRQQFLVYGNQFMYKNKPSRTQKYPTTIFNISPRYIKIKTTGKIFKQITIEDIIKEYIYKDDDQREDKFLVSEILFTKTADIDNPIVGRSLIESLYMALSNIKHAYDYRNVIMSEKGAIGILSNQSKDSAGAVPLSPEEKSRIENAYRNTYGIGAGQDKILITEASLNWQPTTYPTRDLLLFEEVDANKLTIIDQFGSNVNLFSSKNQTFENVRNAIKQVYQDTIQPAADNFMQAISKYLNYEDLNKGKELIASYDHLSILKSDEYIKAQTLEVNIRNVTQLVTSQIISRESGVKMLESLGVILV